MDGRTPGESPTQAHSDKNRDLQAEQLIGRELLSRIEQLSGQPKASIAEACGYTSIKKDGSKRIDFTRFYNAIAYAKAEDRSIPNKRLAGEALLAKLETLEGSEPDRRLQAYLCGYVFRSPNNLASIDLGGFLKALRDANESHRRKEAIANQSLAKSKQADRVRHKISEGRPVSEEELRLLPATERNLLPTEIRLRPIAQKKLAQGKVLTQEEVSSLPSFQQRALLRQKDSTGAPRKASSEQDQEEACTNNSLDPLLPHRLDGNELIFAAASLHSQGLSEDRIARRCGFKHDEKFLFRRALARAAKTKIAPLSKILSSISTDPQSIARDPHDAQVLSAGKGSTSDIWLSPDCSFAEREIIRGHFASKQRSPVFRRRVFQMHGATCACCSLKVEQILEAAHIRPVADNGSDDPRNGIPLCPTHHCAFDLNLFAYNPESLQMEFANGYTAQSLGITRLELNLNASIPALAYRYEIFLKQA